jgi:hypothetical protein
MLLVHVDAAKNHFAGDKGGDIFEVAHNASWFEVQGKFELFPR